MTDVLKFLHASPRVPSHFEKQVFITNILSFVFFWVTLGIFGIFYSLFGWISTLPLILAIAILFLAIPPINRWISHTLGRVCLCLIPVWLTMFVTIFFKINSQDVVNYVFYFDSRFILMATVILPGIVFRLEERLQLGICLGSTSIFLLFYDPIHEFFGAGFYQQGFSDASYSYVNYIVCVTYITLLFGILLLRSILERSERDLLDHNKQLSEKQNEIEAQHEELLQQQEEMLTSSEKLEHANSLILQQQATLEKYNRTLEALVEEKSSELVKTNEELVKHNNELLQFSYTVSHNLRGPVARMLGLTRLLPHAEDNQDRDRLEDMILKSSEELDEILKDLSLIIDIRNDLYRVSEKVVLSDEWGKAVSLVGESVKSIYNLQVDFSSTPVIYGVRPMIQSIFYNLLSNAIKYQSPNRKLWLRVVSTTLADDRKIIEVSDNGLGIDLKNQQQNIFKLYKRFHPHVSGKGLGLYLVKTQVEAMGGAVFVESEPDKGTTFRIVFNEPEEVLQQVFYDNDAVQLYYHGNLRIVVIRWKRQVTSTEYRDAIEALVRSLSSYDSPGWISDVRKVGKVLEQDEAWLSEKILPVLTSESKKWVSVVGLDTVNRRSYYERLVHFSGVLNYELQLASSLDEALQWMEANIQEKQRQLQS